MVIDVVGARLRGLSIVAALLCVAPVVAAQSADPLAPFLGVWSGVFTTQDNEYWGLEDFACFPGCPPETREYMVSLLNDPANDSHPFAELFGRASGFDMQHIASFLTPLGKQIQQANAPETDPKLHCQPYGFVREVTNALPIMIRRDGDNLLIHYEEWSLLRTIYMDGRRVPEHQTPTLFGHSVGRIENGALIVETSNVTPDWISDSTHAGHSGELTGVERYTVRDNPRRLELTFTIKDPLTLTKPYVITKTWLYTPDAEIVQDLCGALPGKF